MSVNLKIKNLRGRNICLSYLMNNVCLLKVQCARFQGVFLQDMVEIEYNNHKCVFITVQLPENKNSVFITLE